MYVSTLSKTLDIKQGKKFWALSENEVEQGCTVFVILCKNLNLLMQNLNFYLKEYKYKLLIMHFFY